MPITSICVAGIGNVLMGDDAFGPYVIQDLKAHYSFPKEVAVAELGTAGADLTVHLDGCEAVIAIDTVNKNASPGSLHLFGREELLSNPVFPLSQHEPGLKEALLTMQLVESMPDRVTLIGVVPKRIETHVGLSDPVTLAIPGAIAAVLEELARLGVVPIPKSPPETPVIWWE